MHHSKLHLELLSKDPPRCKNSNWYQVFFYLVHSKYDIFKYKVRALQSIADRY